MSRLSKIKRGRIAAPLRYLLYGVEGVGKSTLAADAPDAVYLDTEDGSALIDCARFPFRDGPNGHVALSYAEVCAAIKVLQTEEHDFKSLVIDTVDHLEPMIWAHVCAEQSKANGKRYKHIESFGYGKGYTLALNEWRAFCKSLNMLRAGRGMNIVFVGHAQIRTFKNPEGDDYDRYNLKLHEKSSSFLREWCDVVGFCCFEDGAAKMADDDNRKRGYTTGKRIVKFDHTAAYDAKSRIRLPGELELSDTSPWAPIAHAAKATEEAEEHALSVPVIIQHIQTVLDRIDDAELSAKVIAARDKAGDDKRQLLRILNKLKDKG